MLGNCLKFELPDWDYLQSAPWVAIAKCSSANLQGMRLACVMWQRDPEENSITITNKWYGIYRYLSMYSVQSACDMGKSCNGRKNNRKSFCELLTKFSRFLASVKRRWSKETLPGHTRGRGGDGVEEGTTSIYHCAKRNVISWLAGSTNTRYKRVQSFSL